MWTWVDGAEDIVVEGGFAVGDDVVWPVLTTDFDELLPQLPDGLADDVEVASAVDDDGDGEAAGTIVRIVMLTGRRRTSASEITATPAEHVQVLDMAGFLVELAPDA
ncbi:hypothetical protein [Aeromicrobium sp. Root472D3]|uniref:hypothetical protein n=1 Tax=Aeromicrobium sp. Root472D3 TaxID=1736540 RepID=UPI0012FB5B05|nr:hypothetical protein [Aeromicrobium sp. Root472D3]